MQAIDLIRINKNLDCEWYLRKGCDDDQATNRETTAKQHEENETTKKNRGHSAKISIPFFGLNCSDTPSSDTDRTAV